MRKHLDPRIPILINNSVKKNHRSFVVLIGDQGKDQVVNLHYLLSQARVSARPSVLWCYKKELGFTSHRQKRKAKIRRDIERGVRDPDEQDPFEIFVSVTDIRYIYYKESEKILGNTYGMCILQDFEAVTPNLLARTIETVEGGGLIVLLLKTMSSLKQLHAMTMDVHARYRTSVQDSVVARFNERFILSLGSCEDCLFLDDELNVLPISEGKDIAPLAEGPARGADLRSQLPDMADTHTPSGQLVNLAKTADQARAIITFIGAIAEKTLSSTVTLTAARGRGKSAALGLAIAAAIAHGYSNIFVTSPRPENLKTLFEFIFKGLDALGYEEHLDYDIAQSTNPGFNNAIVRVNIFRQHRQTIQYIQPSDSHVLGQAELVVIDEAAAIPLPLVRNLIGAYLVFLASTVHGYEGTGRSLSLKLVQQLRENAVPQETTASREVFPDVSSAPKPRAAHKILPKARSLKEITLEDSIRYSAGDKIEKWLNSLLCLDASVMPRLRSQGCPHPSSCELFYVNRDTLFSYHPASEVFLQRMMALYVASHYRNQPNDLQLLSDAPAHHLFVLLPHIRDDEECLPEPLVVLQVALEGQIRSEAVMDGLGRGSKVAGDMIPWLISQQFQESKFAMLSGARVVRVATHPDCTNMGYGSRALQALNSFYKGEYLDLEETSPPELTTASDSRVSRLTDKLTIRPVTTMPPLLHRLSERKPEVLDYLGVSYGLTPQLLRFWRRAGYVPLYLRQTASELTGEHTCVMVRGLDSTRESEPKWIAEFANDFRRRFISLLSFNFRELGCVTALSILEATTSATHEMKGLDSTELVALLTPFDLKRLQSYANNMLDYHVILDLLPTIGYLFFTHRFRNIVHLSAVQTSILLAIGLQRKTVEQLEVELSLPVSQVLALLVKLVRKISKCLVDTQAATTMAGLPSQSISTPDEGEYSRIRSQGCVETRSTEECVDGSKSEAVREQRASSSIDHNKFLIDDQSSRTWINVEKQVAHSMQAGVARHGKQSTVSITGIVAEGTKRKADDSDALGVQKKAARRGRKGGK